MERGRKLECPKSLVNRVRPTPTLVHISVCLGFFFPDDEVLSSLRTLTINTFINEQEDAHEFLRHLVDKMASSFLTRRGVKAFDPNRLAETTPIHRIFGGYLRSQACSVVCIPSASISPEQYLPLCTTALKRSRLAVFVIVLVFTSQSCAPVAR